jgi:TolB-like protein/Tfp pilus assembly protein PilF
MANKMADLPDHLPEPSPKDRLGSWKEIAAYLKCSERTVRRWEQEGLPVHRHPHKAKAAIYAYKAEIDGWWRNGHERLKPIEEVPEETPHALVGWRRRPWLAAGTVLAAALVAVLWLNVGGWRARLVRRAPNLRIESLAVLPLENLSHDPDQEYFANGITDALITDLAQIGSLKVISRTSSMQYKQTKKSLPQIARELNVDGIVEGTVQRSGERVRITAQLIHGPSDKHLWANSYDREIKDVLRLESDVADEISEQIGHVASAQSGRPARELSISAEAHESYLKGRYHWNQRTESGLRAGVQDFQKAIELQPDYPEAYAGLADSYITLANWRFIAGKEAYPRAEAAARKALELDDHLAEAQTSLAYASFLYDWDWSGAEQRFRRAIELSPNYATAHHFYSIYLMAAGRHAEAQAEIRRAQELDPLSLIINSVVGWIYYHGRQYDLDIQQCERTVEMDPNYAPALMDLGMIYMRTGDYPRALAQFERAQAIAGDTSVVLSYLAQVRALSGNQSEARKILRRLEKPSTPMFVSAWDLALIYAALGEKEKALTQLEKAADQRVGWIVLLGVDPALDSLRAEPRFRALQRRVHIPPPT